ncbi:hypothetical protein WG909_06765 [Peptostreptococcaceae bacterium AGR-M142]
MSSLMAIKMNAQSANYEINSNSLSYFDKETDSLNKANNTIGALSTKIENLCDRILSIKECKMYNLMKSQKVQALEIEIKNLNNKILDIQNRNLIEAENRQAKLKSDEEIKADLATKSRLNDIKLRKISSLNRIKNDIKGTIRVS